MLPLRSHKDKNFLKTLVSKDSTFTQTQRELRIYSRDFIGKINTMNFPRKEAERLVFVDRLEEAEFFVTLFNFRSGQEYREFSRGDFPFDQPEVFSIRVDGYRVLQVNKVNKLH